MKKISTDVLIINIAKEHPETIFQVIMITIAKFIDESRSNGHTILEILRELIGSLNNEMETQFCESKINRKAFQPINPVYKWKSAQKIGKLIFTQQPSTQMNVVINFYVKIIVGWAFVCPKNFLNLQERIHFSGEESNFEIANKIVDYFVMWLCAPNWQDS